MEAMTPKSVMRNLITATGFSSIISASWLTETGPLQYNVECQSILLGKCFVGGKHTYSGSTTVRRSSAASALASFSAVRSRFRRDPRRDRRLAALALFPDVPIFNDV